jgi:hypothetical protein
MTFSNSLFVYFGNKSSESTERLRGLTLSLKTFIIFLAYVIYFYKPVPVVVPHEQGWPTRGPRAACGPKRNFCGPNSNWVSSIFLNFGCISSVFRCIVAQKVNILGKFSKLRPKNQFGLATPAMKNQIRNVKKVYWVRNVREDINPIPSMFF